VSRSHPSELPTSRIPDFTTKRDLRLPHALGKLDSAAHRH
jgi:hypothetical protein